MARGEIPTERGASWFSPKCLEGQPSGVHPGGRALDELGRSQLRTAFNQTTNTRGGARRVRRWGLSFIVERVTDQTAG